MYQIELINKIERGRVIGNSYAVTRRPIGQTTILVSFDTREQAEEWITQQ